MRKYTAEQARACILAYKNGDLNYCRSGIVDLLTEYASILDAEGDGGAAGDAKEYLDNCVNALDHIARTARNCRVTSKRLTWIASRAESAINSNDTWRDAPVPKNGASALLRAQARIKELEAELSHPARSDGVRDGDVRDAARWRFFCDNIGSEYGDGYSEPRENSACLEWQQGPWIRDGSNGGQGRADTFPGWSAIIDKMMEDEQRALEELDDPTDAAIQGERHE